MTTLEKERANHHCNKVNDNNSTTDIKAEEGGTSSFMRSGSVSIMSAKSKSK